MSTDWLPATLGNTEYELEETIPRVPSGQAPRSYMEFIAGSYRRRGMAWLLLTGSAERFFRNAQRSATAWLWFLRNAADAEKATSKAQAFYCAIACDDVETATELARFARYTVNRDEEYEDDFLYVAFLMQTFFLRSGTDASRRLIERMEVLLAGDSTPQVELCRALLAGDSTAFGAAIERRIVEHREWLALAEERGAMKPEELATDGQIFLEGLALVRLAERLGLDVEAEYPLVPALVRNGGCKDGFESWRDFDSTSY